MSLCRTCPRRASCSRPCPTLEKYLRGAAPHGTRGPAHPPARADLAREVRRRLAELTDGRLRLQTIARLYYEEGLTKRQIARRLRAGRGAVDYRIACLRKLLQRRPGQGLGPEKPAKPL